MHVDDGAHHGPVGAIMNLGDESGHFLPHIAEFRGRRSFLIGGGGGFAAARRLILLRDIGGPGLWRRLFGSRWLREDGAGVAGVPERLGGIGIVGIEIGGGLL